MKRISLLKRDRSRLLDKKSLDKSFVAEELEARVLYSAAPPVPIENPNESAEVQVEETANSDKDFESLDGFLDGSSRDLPVLEDILAELGTVSLVNFNNLTDEEIATLRDSGIEGFNQVADDGEETEPFGPATVGVISSGWTDELSYFYDNEIMEVKRSLSSLDLVGSVSTYGLEQIGGLSIPKELGGVELPSLMDTGAVIPESVETKSRESEDGGLTIEKLNSIADAAKKRWIETGLTDRQLEAIESIEYRIADLGSTRVGMAEGKVVTIDINADGRDWFIDYTPGEDEEFIKVGVNEWQARDGIAGEGVDLLTVVMHEQGHVIGLFDENESARDNLMEGVIEEGIRRVAYEGQASGVTPGSVKGKAYLSVPTAGTAVTVDFTGFDGSGFAPTPAAGQLDSDDWRVTGFSAGDGAFGGTHTDNDFARGQSSGGETTGGAYAFDVGGGNIALGIQSSASDFTPGTIDLNVTNDTGGAINTLEIAYDIFVFNDQGRSNSFNFAYSTDGSSFTDVASLDFTTTEAADGTPAWGSTNRTATIDLGTNIAAGGSIILRWLSDDVGGGGSRDEIALDNVSVTLSAATLPPGFSLSKTTATVEETGTTDTFTVTLNAQPATDVVLNIANPGTDEVSVSPATLTFTNANWDTPQTVTLTGVDDSGLQDGSQDTVLTISVDDLLSDDAYDPVADQTVTVTTLDDDTPVPQVTINEIRHNQTGADIDFVELIGAPNTNLSGLTLVVISGEFNPGLVDFAIDLSPVTTDANGIALIANDAIAGSESGDLLVGGLDFFGSPSTYLVVEGFSGSQGADLDTGDDGTLDSTPWTNVQDSVSFLDGDATPDISYSTTTVAASGDFTQAGVARNPDGTGAYTFLAFDDTSADTPGELNVAVTGPDITISGNGVPISLGDSTPDLADHTDFGSVGVGGAAIVRTFTVTNSGIGTLTLTDPVSITGGGSVRFSASSLGSTSLGAGESTTFTVTYSPDSAAGNHTATVSLTSDDPDENPFTFDITGETTAPAPEIDITGNGVSISSGDATPSTADNTDFGVVSSTAGSVTRVFTVTNSGAATLTLTSPPTVSGAGSARFSAGPLSSTSLAQGEMATFNVTFNTGSVAGTFDAVINLVSDDSDENPYTFAVRGQTFVPAISTLFSESFDSDSGFTKNEIFFTDGDNDYFGLFDGGNRWSKTAHDFDGHAAVSPPNHFGGTGRYLAGEHLSAADVEDSNGIPGEVRSGTRVLTWTGLNIAGQSNLTLSADLSANRGSWDAGDQITLAISIDGGAFVDVIDFQHGERNVLTDGNVSLGQTFQTISSSIPGTGSTATLRLTVTADGANEEFAIDNIQIIGEAPTAPLTVANSVVEQSEGEVGSDESLTMERLLEVAEAAKQRWISTGLTIEQIAALDAIEYRITGLEANRVGMTEGNVILIDDDAAQRGWFIDDTPLQDEEFIQTGETTYIAHRGTEAVTDIDLVTVVMHEQGHILGLQDESVFDVDDSLMYGLISEGQRRLAAAGQADGSIAGSLEGAQFMSTLSEGNIAFVGFNADDNDDFAFVGLVDIPGNEIIFFTDDEWNGSSFNTGEGFLKWTAPAGGVSAGTVITIDGVNNTVDIGSLSSEAGDFNLGASGDQIFAYQAATHDGAVSSFLTAFTSNGTGGDLDLTNTGLSVGVNAIDFASVHGDGDDGGYYSGIRSGEASFADYATLINDANNWGVESSTGANAVPNFAGDFTTSSAGDTTAPIVSTLSPADDASNVAIDANLVITFDEDVQKGTGSITIHLSSNDSVVQTIDVTDAAVTVSGSTVTIDPGSDLANGTEYYVNIAGTAFDDLAGNSYVGIGEATTWNFTTAAPASSVLNSLVFNEVLPDPNSGSNNFDTDGDGSAETADEFVEIYNISGSIIDVSGLQFWDSNNGNYFTIPDNTLLGGNGFIVVVASVDGGSLPTVQAGSHAFSPGSGMSLSNGGENQFLYDPTTDEYLHAIYNGDALDDPTTDVTGFSATATRIGTVQDLGNDTDGVSIALNPDGSVGSPVQHNTIGDGSVLATPGASNTAPADVTGPSVSTLSPADDATGVAVGSNLVITFDEGVVKGTGNVTIYRASDDSVVETIDVASGAVTVVGNEVTIDPANDLANDTSYYVQVAGTAFDDESGNDFAGIGDTTSWSFTTVSANVATVLDETFADATQFTITDGNDASATFFSDGFGDYFGIYDGGGDGGENFGSGSTPSGVTSYTGFDDNYLTNEDMDGEGGVLPFTLTWGGLDIDGLSDLEFSVDLGSTRSDPDDFVTFEYRIDGGSWVNALSVRGEATNGTTRVDTNLDGTGDGTALSGALQTLTHSIAGAGATLDLRLITSNNNGDDNFAIDNVRITGTPPTPTQIFQESFELAPGTGYTLTTAFDDGGFDFFGRYSVPDNDNQARDDFQNGWDQSFGIMGQDHDGDGGSATNTITISNIAITGVTGLQTQIAVGAQFSDTFQNFEAGDGIEIYATIDGGTRTLIGRFVNPGADGNLQEDTNLDGTGDGAVLNFDLADFTFDIGGTGDAMTLEIELTNDDSFEMLAVDNVRVLGVGTPTDSVAPTFTSITRQTPSGEATNADSLVFLGTFSEDVENVDTTDFAVNGGTSATVTNVNQLSASTYEITVSGGDLATFEGTVGLDLANSQDIRDLAANALPGTEPGTDETYLVDNTAPTVSGLSPADDATNVAVGSDLVLTFDENVLVGTGNITIHQVGDDLVVETIDVTGGAVTVVDNVVTINPVGDLATGAGYYVQVASTAFTNEAGIAYAGIADKTSWSFTTTAVAPTVVLNETFADASGFTITDGDDAAAAFFSDGSNDYFGILDGGSDGGENFGSGSAPSGVPGFSNFDDNYLVTEDADGEGATLPFTLTWSGLDIDGLTDLQFSVDLASTRNDADDYLTFQYQIDGTGGYQNLVSFRGIDFNTAPRQDGDFDDVADPSGAQLSAALQTISNSIAGSGTTLDLRMIITTNNGDDNWAVDNVRITGQPGGDTAVPSVSTLSPVDDATDVAVDSDLVITFDEDVQKGTGNITIRLSSDDSAVQTIDVTDNSVTVNGSTVTIDPGSDLGNGTEYYVQIDATAFDDLAGNSFVGITDTTSWSFTTAAALGPDLFISEYVEGSGNNKALEFYNPTGGTLDLSQYTLERYNNGATTNPTVVVLGDILANLGAGQTLVIGNSSADQAILDVRDNTDGAGATATFYNGDDALLLKKNGVVIDQFGLVGEDPGTNWSDGTRSTSEQTLRRKDGTTQGNPNGFGTSDISSLTNEWDTFAQNTFDGLGQFGADVAAPNVSTLSPVDDATDVAIDSNLVITFDEDIQIGTGNITIHLASDDSAVQTIDVTDASQVTVNGATMTIDPASDLGNGMEYYVQIAATAIDDLAGNSFVGITDTTSWSFTTAAAPVTPQFNEFEPNPDGGDPSNQDIEITGEANASFDLWVVSIESDGFNGTVDRATNVTGTFDANGRAVVSVPDLENPSFTLVLTDNFTGTVGTTDIDSGNDGGVDTSTFGTIFDALGVPDSSGDSGTLYGAALGGTDLVHTGDSANSGEPSLVFRDGTSGDWFQVVLDQVYDEAGAEVSPASFDTDPTAGNTFDADNPIFTADSTAPMVNTLSPADDATNVAADSNLVVAFDELVRAGAGNIVINNVTDGTVFATIEVGDAQVDISGATLTINPTSDLIAGKEFEVVIASGVIEDLAGNDFAGIASGEWNFATPAVEIDPTGGKELTNASEYQGNLRVDGSADAVDILNAQANLFVANFDPEVEYGADGAALSTLTWNGSGVTASFDLPFGGYGNLVSPDTGGTSSPRALVFSQGGRITLDSAVDGIAFSVNRITEGLTVRLYSDAAGTTQIGSDFVFTSNDDPSFFAFLEAGAGIRQIQFQDAGASGSQFNIDDLSIVTSTTGISSTTPVDGATGVALGDNLSITFDENVQAGAGNIVISDGSADITIDVTDTNQVTFSGATMTINPTSDLVLGSNYHVLIDAGAVESTSGSPFAGINDSTTWNFATLTDGTAPTISTISGAASSTTHIVGDTISVTVGFSESVTLSGEGDLQLTLDVGGTDVVATQVGSTLTGTSFTFVTGALAAGLSDSDGVDVKTDSLALLNSGTLQDGAGNNADLSNALTNLPNDLVDAVIPTVNLIEGSESVVTYKLGDTISVTVGFSESVTLSGEGDLQLTLDVGGADVVATQVGSTLTGTSFTFVTGALAAGLSDSDGVDVKANSLALINSGALQDAAGNRADLNNSLTNLPNDQVDSVVPTVLAISGAASSTTHIAGDTISVTVEFSESMTLASEGDLQLTLDVGGTDVVATQAGSTLTGTSFTFVTGSLAAGLSDSDGVDVKANSLALINSGTLQDGAGNGADLTNTLTNLPNDLVDAVVPVVSVLSPVDGATDVAAGSNLVVTFDQNISLGTGNITITPSSGNAIVIDVTNSNGQISVSGSSITINPIAVLEGGTSYSVQIDATVVRDANGNPFAGINDTTTWNFTTGDEEIDVSGAGAIISDGDLSPEAADNSDFGEVDTVSGTDTHTFVIENSGVANLTISTIAIGGSESGDFAVGGFTANTVVAPGGSTTFTVTFNPSADGLRQAEITINNSDSDEAVFNFAVQGTGVTLPPTPAISGPIAVNAGTPITYVIDFGEAVDGFVQGDVVLTNATLNSFTDNGNGNFTIEVLPINNEAEVSVDIPAGVATSSAGRGANEAATFATIQLGEGAGDLVGIQNIFRDLGENELFFGVRATETADSELGGEQSPLLEPFVSGVSRPGATISIIIKDRAGFEVGRVETVANLNGEWTIFLREVLPQLDVQLDVEVALFDFLGGGETSSSIIVAGLSLPEVNVDGVKRLSNGQIFGQFVSV